MCPLKGCFGVCHTVPLDCVGHHKRLHQRFCAWSPTPNDGWDLITLLDRQSAHGEWQGEVDSAPGKATLCIFLTATPPSSFSSVSREPLGQRAFLRQMLSFKVSPQRLPNAAPSPPTRGPSITRSAAGRHFRHLYTTQIYSALPATCPEIISSRPRWSLATCLEIIRGILKERHIQMRWSICWENVIPTEEVCCLFFQSIQSIIIRAPSEEWLHLREINSERRRKWSAISGDSSAPIN